MRINLRIHETWGWPRARRRERSGSKDPSSYTLKSFILALEAVLPRCRLEFDRAGYSLLAAFPAA